MEDQKREGRRKPSKPVLIAVFAAASAILIALIAAIGGIYHAEHPPTFNVVGNVVVDIAPSSLVDFTTCTEHGNFGIGAGTKVQVLADDQVVGHGELTPLPGTKTTTTTWQCNYLFVVGPVPAGHQRYIVEVGGNRTAPMDETAIRNDVTLTITLR